MGSCTLDHFTFGLFHPLTSLALGKALHHVGPDTVMMAINLVGFIRLEVTGTAPLIQFLVRKGT